jgi:D-alanine transaminase
MLACLDGTLLPLGEARVSVLDRGFMFGDGVYEVVQLQGARPLFLEEHLARFHRSLAALRIAVDGARLRDDIARVIAGAGLADGTVYWQATRGAPPVRAHAFQTRGEPNPFEDAFPPSSVPPTVFIYAMPLGDDHDAEREEGCRAITFADLRWARCDVKSLNLLGNVLAAQAAKEAGAFEAILVRDGGTVSEGSHSNVFAVVDGRLRTMPEGPAILSGITRGVVLSLARARGLPVEERAVTVGELGRASELLLTGTTTEVMPVVLLDGRAVGDGRPGPVTRLLQRAYAGAIAGSLSDGAPR